MRIYEKDYRYLLLHLVPQHRLSPGLRRQVGSALFSGDAAALRNQAVRALEELCESDYMTRVDVRPENSHVLVAYERPGGSYRVSVSVPAEEWADVGPAPEAAREAPSPGVPPSSPPPAQPPARVSDYRHVTDIVRSFAIADRSEPVMARLETLLGTIRSLVDMVDVRLFLLDDVVAGQEARGDLVHVVSDDELRETDVLRSTIETGAQRLYARDEVAPGDWGGAGGGEWSVLGAAPVFSMGKVHGVFCGLFTRGLDRAALSERLRVAADTVRRVIEYHNQIENMTSVDALTGLYNRHFYDDQMPVEIERAMRSGSVLSMLVLDLDDFKSINDELGHKKGDEALGAVSELIRRNLRKVDLPFRYGGEEIVILLPGTSELESVHTAERLRRVIAEYEGFRDHRGRPRRITASVGVSVYPNTARTADDLFTQADGAMYRAKQQGKNRVVLYRDDREEESG